jgi:hypothetical protein
MIRFASILLLMLTSATLCAQEPAPKVAPQEEAKIVLEAPSTARVGELVRFDVSDSVADSFEWLVVPPSQDFEVYAEGRKAVFSARMEGEYQFIVACAKDGTVDVIQHVVRVIGPPPMPTDESLADWIPFWAFTMNLPTDGAQDLAQSFEDVAARAEELKEPQDWIKATAEANRAALGDKLAIWKPILNKIGEVLLKKAQSGELMTPEQHKTLWLEIASGLRKL